VAKAPPLPHLDRLSDAVPHARLLGNGRYAVVLTGAGTGFSTCDGLALTAWRGDRTEDADGVFVYVRDVEAGALWSVGHEPVRATGGRTSASYRPGVLTLRRVHDGITATLETAVAPDADVEIRCLTLRNRGRRRRRIEVTTYAEVVLHHAAAHAAHPAFSKLFVETEHLAGEGLLLARRRPRAVGDRTAWLVHALAGLGRLQHETARPRFVGRGRSPACPLALSGRGRLAGTTGSVLDPILSLRRTVVLAPGAETELVLVLGMAATRDEAIALGRSQRQAAAILAAAEAAERALLARLGLSEREAERYQELLGGVLYGDPALRPGDAILRRLQPRSAHEGPAVARTGGPLVIVDASGARGMARSRDAARATRYWEAKGVPVQLVVLDATHAALPPAERDRLLAEASAVIGSSTPRPAPRPRPARWAPLASSRTARARGRARARRDDGHGGFAPDGSEYIIHLGADGARPPMPWINVVANEDVGFLASESGAGYTWSRNSREHRLTPWANDPVVDPHGEALWIRDEDVRRFWSPLPGPTAAGVPCEVRHGFGYTCWRQTCADLEQEVVAFVPRRDPLRIVRVRLRNASRRRRRLSLFGYARLVLGVTPEESARTVVTARDASSQALLAWNALAGDFGDGIAFAAAVIPPGGGRARVTTDRAVFVGRHGSLACPAAVAAAATLDGRTGAALDSCAALQVPLTVRPGETVEASFLLGETRTRADARALVARYRRPGAIDEALAAVQLFWRETLSAVSVETPAPGLDVMLNGWLLYQDLACRIWARSAFYQSGGAFGFRDQLQDAMALVWARPELSRAQIVLHAAHQFTEGDVLHWWHPPSGRGTRTRFSDDLVWLAWATAFYVRTTGDWTILDEPAPFVRARPLAAGEDEAYLLPEPAGETADVYAHCCRALDRALTRGAHGLPLMGTGDWNDGMNRVGREGRGESVWMAFFLYAVLGDFAPLCERRGDAARAARYAEYRRDVRAAVEATAWDGAWYRRAYYDDGTPLGSAASDECRIDGLVQAWAVISGAAPRERAAQAMDAVERELVDEEAGLVRLLWPPFDRTPHDPGYIKGYLPGIRENGGQYTHAALWVVRALAELGRRDRAATLLERIGPAWHGATRDRVVVYQVEPYVVAADIYGVPPHVGRGGWTWYTGSAGWMYRVALESVLGVTIEAGQTLCVRPRIPDRWPRASVVLRLADGVTRYEVELANPMGRAERVVAAAVDGVAAEVVDGAARVPIVRDGRVRRVRVELG